MLLLFLMKRLECKLQVLETLIAEKESKLKKVSLELKRTQKSLKMHNLGTSKLEHILTLRKLEHILTLGKPNRDRED